MPRDNFPMPIRQTLAERAAFICANPRCHKLTVGPRVKDTRALRTGHAAHICGASKLGPRYNEDQSPEARKSINNGIWLCRECGDIVDKDDGGYSVEQLHDWKRRHDTMISEIRMQGWSKTMELLRGNHSEIGIAQQIIALFEDRRAFWVAFDAEFPDRVRQSMENLRHQVTALRVQTNLNSPIDVILVALASTIRRFFDEMEEFDLAKLRCNSFDPAWRSFETALLALRKSIGIQVSSLATAYEIALQGEFAIHQASV